MLGSTEADLLLVRLATVFLDSFNPQPQQPDNGNLQSLNIDFQQQMQMNV